MRDSPAPRWLRRLVPRDVAADIFDPAWHDLRHAHATRVASTASPARRAMHGMRHAGAALLLVADCWRVGRARPPARRPHGGGLAMMRYYLRHAVRLLARDRAFTFGAALTLALGVGANVAVFGVVEAVLLRPLPYPDADAIVIVRHEDLHTRRTKDFIRIGDYVDMAARQTTFAAFGAYGTQAGTVSGLGDPFRASALIATDGALAALGMRPILGRGLEPADSRPDAAGVVVLGYEFWQQRFGSDPFVMGRALRLGSMDFQIVGVAPPGFRFPVDTTTDLILPETVPIAAPAQRSADWTFAVARLKPGATVASAAAELTTISTQMAQEHPAANEGSHYFPVTLRDALVGSGRIALELLLAIVGVVLLIACANVANLLLARSLGRRREMAVRLALGADRRHLLAQLLAESVVLAGLASAAGVAAAVWGAHALVAMAPEAIAVRGMNDVHLNAPVLAFALGLTVLTTLVFAVASALTVRSQSPTGSLVMTRVTMSRAARRAGSALVIVELSLAVVLLIGAGLVLRSMMRIASVDPGFQTDHVATVTINIPTDRYQAGEARQAFYDRAVAAVRALPGVQAVGTAAVVPLTGNNWTTPFEREDQRVPAGQKAPDVGWQVASGGYFTALHIPLLSGRLFDSRDTLASAPVVIVSRSIEQRFFPGESAVGHRLVVGKLRPEIVGVVGDIRRASLGDEPRADLYLSAEQAPATSTTWFVRTSDDPARALASVQATLRGVEPDLTAIAPRTMLDVANASTQVLRFAMWLFGVFAVTALALAAVGVYGVMAYVTRQRTREIGTRTALGATRADIVWLVMRQGGSMAVMGVAIGLAVGIAAARLTPLDGLLYATSTVDPATLVLAPATLVVAALAACYLPARRASRIDPARTLAE